MLIGFIKHNRSVSIVLLPVALIIIQGYGFFHPVVPSTEHTALLYQLLISGIGDYPFLITLISFLLVFCEAMLLNHIVEKNEIIDTTTYLPALAYIVLMSLQPEMFSLHPIVIANLFMLLALHKLMQTYRQETAYSEAFNTGFFIALATLFYIPSVIFILLLWIGLILIRPFIWREWVISFIGFALPWIYLVFYYFWNDKLKALDHDLIYYPVIASGKSFYSVTFSYSEYMQIAILHIAAFFSAGRFLRDFNKNTIRSRINLLLILYFLFSLLFPSYWLRNILFLISPFLLFLSLSSFLIICLLQKKCGLPN